MDSSAYAGLVTEASRPSGLAKDDQRLAQLRRHAALGVGTARTALEQIVAVGGIKDRSVNKVV